MIALIPDKVLSVILICYFVIQATPCKSQADFVVPQYNFINYDSDTINILGSREKFDNIFTKLNELIIKGRGKINIVHIGDSHVQADYFSGRVREDFQTYFQGALGSRGFIFPYKLLRSNNPFNFYVNSTGEWTGCRNIEKSRGCYLGLAGAMTSTTDPNAGFSIKLRSKDYPAYDFNKVKIFHKTDTLSYDVFAGNFYIKEEFTENDSIGYTQFLLTGYTDSVDIFLKETDTAQNHFTLYGLSLENDDDGITYHSVGVNGAEVESFLRCNLLAYQLSLLSPDLVILSLGTNDCYSAKWDTTMFEKNLDSLIMVIHSTLTGIPVLLTTPCDHFRKRKVVNSDIEVAVRIMLRTASARGCAIWNLYEIMGGKGSMAEWHKAGLAVNDRIHFNRAGYYLQGDLLFAAFLKTYDYFLEKSNR